MSELLVHKRTAATNGRGPRTVCGQYGYQAVLWRKVTCPVCLRKKEKR